MDKIQIPAATAYASDLYAETDGDQILISCGYDEGAMCIDRAGAKKLKAFLEAFLREDVSDA